MNSNINNCYKREPLKIVDGIPVFSETDFYIENYNSISTDHVNSIQEGSENPWISEEIWNQMESSTIQLVVKYLGNGEQRILDVGVGMGDSWRK